MKGASKDARHGYLASLGSLASWQNSGKLIILAPVEIRDTLVFTQTRPGADISGPFQETLISSTRWRILTTGPCHG